MIDRDLTNREKLIMKCVWAENREISIQDLQDKLKEMFNWDAKKSTVPYIFNKHRRKRIC